ncbi:RNA-protein complex protein Nop10 [Candidatus Bathyarchaeota archaeon]|nr:RNA-protein complex protein Nop10 [Candidatus Bathyarchaeota archaeon]MCK5631284.1 RNA-protein complex protein Nop10 [Candidatus Bathyarchaeota archaeon]
MGWLLRKCEKCNQYTLSVSVCPYCKSKVHIPHPAKFSPDDKYARYRIALKEGSIHENHDKRRT